MSARGSSAARGAQEEPTIEENLRRFDGSLAAVANLVNLPWFDRDRFQGRAVGFTDYLQALRHLIFLIIENDGHPPLVGEGPFSFSPGEVLAFRIPDDYGYGFGVVQGGGGSLLQLGAGDSLFQGFENQVRVAMQADGEQPTQGQDNHQCHGQ